MKQLVRLQIVLLGWVILRQFVPNLGFAFSWTKPSAWIFKNSWLVVFLLSSLFLLFPWGISKLRYFSTYHDLWVAIISPNLSEKSVDTKRRVQKKKRQPSWKYNLQKATSFSLAFFTDYSMLFSKWRTFFSQYNEIIQFPVWIQNISCSYGNGSCENKIVGRKVTVENLKKSAASFAMKIIISLYSFAMCLWDEPQA